MNVWIVDERLYDQFPNSTAQFQAYLVELNHLTNTIAFGVDQNWNMHRICDRARQLSGGSIGIMVIDCHGNSSQVQFGTGLRVPGDAIGFQMLRNCWVGAYPRIEVQACATISSTPVCAPLAPPVGCTPGPAGTISTDHSRPEHLLMQRIANNAGVLVIASYDIQNWGPGFEGRIHHYRPAVYHTQ